MWDILEECVNDKEEEEVDEKVIEMMAPFPEDEALENEDEDERGDDKDEKEEFEHDECTTVFMNLC